MKITLTDGRAELFQWDTGVSVQIDGIVNQFHFSNKVLGRSVDVDAVQGDNVSTARIPDILLQVPQPLRVFAFVGTPESGYTKLEQDFTVKSRNKPNDYVFTPTEQMTIDEIKAIADEAERIAQSVRDDADAGRFKGDKGDKGEKGDKGDPGTGGGTFDHNELINRDMANQHPISAIGGLTEALAGKQTAGDYALKSEIPDTSNLATKQEVEAKADKTYVDTLIGNLAPVIDSINGTIGGDVV